MATPRNELLSKLAEHLDEMTGEQIEFLSATIDGCLAQNREPKYRTVQIAIRPEFKAVKMSGPWGPPLTAETLATSLEALRRQELRSKRWPLGA